MSLGVAEKLKVSPKIKSISVNDDRHIAIKWSKVPLAEKYAVKRATEAGGEFEHLTWVKKCEFVDETAEENTTYWYKITAWKKLEGKKTSTKTSGVKAAIISDIKAPDAITAKSKGKKVAASGALISDITAALTALVLVDVFLPSSFFQAVILYQ